MLAHRSGWRAPITTLLFLLLALLGSLTTVYGTLGRQADARDVEVGSALAENRTLQLRSEAPDTAKRDAGRECNSGVGHRCTNSTARVDKLVGEMASLRTVNPDPRADAIADLLWLFAGVDKARVRQIVAAIDPLLLPIFLELGSVVLLASAFPHRKASLEIVDFQTAAAESVGKVFTRDEALLDFRSVGRAGSQQFLANGWRVSESCVSKWLKNWQDTGVIDRHRLGKEKRVFALSTRKTPALPWI